MALTRNFRETILARAERDAAFRAQMLREAVANLLNGDVDAGKGMLRDYINATLGFERLAEATGKPAKSLHRMLGSSGNPTLDSFVLILKALQKFEGIDLAVSTRRRAT